MPSLQALRDFKASFNRIGGETSVRGEGNIPFEGLELPDHEPALQTERSAAQDSPPAETGMDFSFNDFSPDTDAGAGEPDFTFDDFNNSALNLDDIPGGTSAPSGEAPEGDDADLLALLDTIPDDLGQTETPAADLPETPVEPVSGTEPAVPVEPENAEIPGDDDFSIPGDLLEGLGDIPENAPADDFGDFGDLLGDMEGGESPPEPSADLPETDDFSIPGMEPDGEALTEDMDGELLMEGGEGPAEPPADLPETDDFSIPGMEPDGEALTEDLDGELLMEGGESPAELSADLPETDDFSIPGLEPDGEALTEDLDGELLMEGGESPPESPTSLPETDDFSIPGMEPDGEMLTEDLDGELLMEGRESPADLPEGDDFSIPGMEPEGETPTENLAAEDILPDSFDNFNPGGDIFDTGFGGTDEAGGGGPEGLDEFTLPGIDDVFTGGIPGTGGKAGPEKTTEEVEEIQLSDEELAQFQKTLAGYPLNLRIACEELIAEQAVAPDLMSRLIKLLIRNAPAKETASLAGKIVGRTIVIPRGFEKSTGEALEAEQGSFAYIFVHNFLPVLRLFLMIAVAAASLFYLIYQFIYTPLRAESIYKLGFERLLAGDYQRANDRFSEAFRIHRNKNWFYRYAEAFRDERQYLYAEEKYDELLRFYPRDKKGVLDYAAMETAYMRNYAKAETLLRRNLLDYNPNDREGLLALGNNSLAWGEIDSSKYEDARFSYARLLELYGWTDPVVEQMLKYFIRTDNLKETLALQAYFNNRRRKISADALAELGGYLLDKRLEEVRGVPNEYVEQIEGIRELLLRAVGAAPSLPEPHYHLARYYHNLNNTHEEQITLETAIRAFDSSPEGSVRRISYRIDAQKRYADILINNREFFPAEEQLVKGISIYEDALSRRLLARSPEFGKLYAGMGDLEYFTKAGNMELALQYYRRSEQHGWAPPEILYRMGSAHYQREEWRDALERFFTASAELPLNRRLLYALGNASYQRGDYFAAQGYYNRLLDILETARSRLPLLLPNDQPEFVELAERLMIARNNMGVVYEALTEQTGDNRYRSRALALYSESARAWDTLTRNPQTMIRSLPAPGLYGPGINLPYLNSRDILYPQPAYEPQIFIRIDKDVLEPSAWERLAPPGSRLSQ